MKKLPLAIIVFTLSAIFAAAAQNSKILSSYTPPNGANLTTFYLVWLGGETQAPALYVPVADKYLRVHFAPKQQIGQKYAIPYTKQLKFFSLAMKDGKEVFEPQETLALPSADAIVGIGKAGEGLHSYAADISLGNIPLGSSAIINLAPYKIGFAYKNKNISLETFGIWRTKFPKMGEFYMGQISFFDIRKKPRLMLQRMHGNTESERAILYIFGTEIPKSEAIPLDTNQILPIVETAK
ncbi:MAG: hypothetical protein IKO42_03300 [Opitutales bacterium]|nr:hypothetical protein [Opitutales bacterium]